MEKERGRQPATWSLARVTAALMTCRKNRRRPLDRQTQTDTGSADGGRLTELALKHCCPSADERERDVDKLATEAEQQQQVTALSQCGAMCGGTVPGQGQTEEKNRCRGEERRSGEQVAGEE